jgi:hypothetical protein
MKYPDAAETRAHALAATVGVVDQPALWAAAVQRHLERVEHELGAQVLGHRPADNQPGEQVLDVREVQEPLPSRDVGDVRRPRLVRAGRPKVALNQIRSHPHSAQANGRTPALTQHNPGDTGRSHQPLNPLSTDPDTMLEPQLGVNPPSAVGAL